MLAIIAGLVMAVMFTAPAHAQSQARLAGHPIGVCILPATGPIDPATALRDAGRFDCSGDQRKYGSGDFWAISEPIGLISSETRPLAVRAASLWQGTVTLHVVYADNVVASMVADGWGMSRRLQIGAISQFELPPRDAAITHLLWRIDDSANMRGVLLGTRIVTLADSAYANLAMAALYAAFGGLAFALLVYNFALWGALRHRFQLAYCAMVAALMLYALSSSGALAWLYPDIANNDRLRINYLMLSVAAAAALAFARTFFEDAVFPRWLSRLSIATMGVVLAGGVLFFVGAAYDVVLFDRIFAWSFLVLLIVLPPILWRAWAVGSAYLWLFAIAWAAPVTMASARAMHNLGLLEWHFWLDNSTILAMAAEALLSSVAIAYRIHLLSVERDFAVAQEAVQRRLADTDPLTGLLNRRAFLNAAIGRPGTHSLMLIDIDNFKTVNETLGHDGGDEVLRIFARVLRQVASDGELVARLGGEEFAILTAARSGLDPDTVLARVRSARMPFDLDVTASVGICTGPIAREIDWKAMYRCADRALFDAKSAGRDRVKRSEAILQDAA